MLHINRIQVLGNIGNIILKDIADRETGEVINKVARVSIATNRTYKKKDDTEVKEVQWHSVICWGKLHDVVKKYAFVGMPVIVSGRMEYRKWQDDKDNERTTAEIIAQQFIVLDKLPERKETKKEKKKQKNLNNKKNNQKIKK